MKRWRLSAADKELIALALENAAAYEMTFISSLSASDHEDDQWAIAEARKFRQRFLRLRRRLRDAS